MLVQKAKEFATKAHSKQIRKYTKEPYIVHPTAVAKLVSDVTTNQEIIAAAYLHDVVEDTHYMIEDIENRFGSRVASIVNDLTNITKKSDASRAYRKSLEREHIKTASPEAKTIKLADIIDNTKNVHNENPEFAKTYMAEKRKMLEVLKEGDITLYVRAKSIIDQYFQLQYVTSAKIAS